MTWGWAVKGDNLGTPAESAVKASWPDYNAQYLKNKLDEKERRFDPGQLGDVEKHVYLQESVKGYAAEAEACLKSEFEEWLQGTHPANWEAERGYGHYVNDNGDFGPKRRHVYDGVVSAEMKDDQGGGHTGWRATRWGTKQLTHLDGVRDFLRAGKVAEDNASRDMNLLAERGPQDLNEAWMYFKHWVKKRPVQTCDEKGPPGYQTDRLNTFQVDRMNGTGPSNWMSRDSNVLPHLDGRRAQWQQQAAQQPNPNQQPRSMDDTLGIVPRPQQPAPSADFGGSVGKRLRQEMANIEGVNVEDPDNWDMGDSVGKRLRRDMANIDGVNVEEVADDWDDDDDAKMERKPDITGLKREDVELPSRKNDPKGNPNPRYEPPSSPPKMSKPPLLEGDYYNALRNSRAVMSSKEGKRRAPWGPARTGIQRTEWSSSPLSPYGQMQYGLKDGENPHLRR